MLVPTLRQYMAQNSVARKFSAPELISEARVLLSPGILLTGTQLFSGSVSDLDEAAPQWSEDAPAHTEGQGGHAGPTHVSASHRHSLYGAFTSVSLQ